MARSQEAGVSVEVLAGGACFVASCGATAISAMMPQDPPVLALLVGWPVFALAGAVLLDQQPGRRPGRVLIVLSLMPVVDLVWALIRARGVPTAGELTDAVATLAPLQAVAVGLALPWSFRTPRFPRWSAAVAALAIAGAAAAATAKAITTNAVGSVITTNAVGNAATANAAGTMVSDNAAGDAIRGNAAWVLSVVGCAIVWTLILAAVRSDPRAARRRTAWVVMSLAASAVVLAVAWAVPSPGLGAYVTMSVLALIALITPWLSLTTDFRPLDEHLFDLGLAVAVVTTASLTGLLVRAISVVLHLPSPGTSALFASLTTAAMATPAALWIRRAALSRRYGSGLLAPADFAAITAGLQSRTDPRELLDEAARMVATASGGGHARIVLTPDDAGGDGDPPAAGHWVQHALVVGANRVGALVIEYRSAEGPEPRQREVAAQLLPTVALVARAVGLAVEAEHARRDVARERDAERRRVLGDLHDGLGPILAGMSMRVQAALRARPGAREEALLEDLSRGLAESRTDLRRIVAGITPSTLDDGDLATALDRLVESFQRVSGGPRLTLEFAVERELSPAVQVAVYRSVAEGVTNALRHAAASTIRVDVRTNSHSVRAEVADDGTGGPIAPGVGLSSLRQRAGALGGQLRITTAAPHGTRLWLDLPAEAHDPTASAAQETPDTQDAPDTQEAPGVREAAGTQESACLNEVPDMRKAPDMQDAAAMQDAAGRQETPDTRKAPGTPEMVERTGTRGRPVTGGAEVGVRRAGTGRTGADT
ncbi:hypothetical protein JIG36_36225 [Actinoplanes sp. LDG1-06]|uniref:histidine kinase n=1 Tax=Paractinoplanes ovalisporus TaxID=2810368 RepID=A0ABS2ANY8_9ACTN|nr:ATP-binding protein [Actinoplanes ovalisporus]MBM2620961.1 hypothetical protein [Actinoplanes ovalisporus]